MLPWACERSLPHREGTSDYGALGDRLKPTPAQVAHGDGRQEAAVGGPQQLPALAGHSASVHTGERGQWPWAQPDGLSPLRLHSSFTGEALRILVAAIVIAGHGTSGWV